MVNLVLVKFMNATSKIDIIKAVPYEMIEEHVNHLYIHLTYAAYLYFNLDNIYTSRVNIYRDRHDESSQYNIGRHITMDIKYSTYSRKS